MKTKRRVSGWWGLKTNTILGSDGSFRGSLGGAETDKKASRIAVWVVRVSDYRSSRLDFIFNNEPSVKKRHIRKAIHFEIIDREVLYLNGYPFIKKFALETRVGPGNNYFSDDALDVWTDGDGLHLTIAYITSLNAYASTEVFSPDYKGYGSYIWTTSSPVNNFPPWLVLGLFSWDSWTAHPSNGEIDHEIAKWGDNAATTNAQFVVQPWETWSPQRYTISTDGPVTYAFYWTSSSVYFASYEGEFTDVSGDISKLQQISEYGFTPTDPNDIPPPNSASARINLWITDVGNFNPNDLGSFEVVINYYQFCEDDFRDINGNCRLPTPSPTSSTTTPLPTKYPLTCCLKKNPSITKDCEAWSNSQTKCEKTKGRRRDCLWTEGELCAGVCRCYNKSICKQQVDEISCLSAHTRCSWQCAGV